MDPTTEEEEEIKAMLPTIARICGQEARNFLMGGMFISQQATGLAWLRKMALMVIVHQLLMQNEKELACNENKEVVKDMETWPIGRTYVYGVGFSKTGPLTVQQPYFARTVAIEGDGYTLSSTREEESSEEDTERREAFNGPDTETLPVDENEREALEHRALEAYKNGVTGPREMERQLGCSYHSARILCKKCKDLIG